MAVGITQRQLYGVTGNPNNLSGTVTAANVSQTLTGANINRFYLLITNPNNAAGTLWVNFTGLPATVGAPAIGLDPGDVLEYATGFVPNGPVAVLHGTAGAPFTCLEL